MFMVTKKLGLPNVIIVSTYVSSHAFLTKTSFISQHLSPTKLLIIFPMTNSWALHSFLFLFMVEEKDHHMGSLPMLVFFPYPSCWLSNRISLLIYVHATCFIFVLKHVVTMFSNLCSWFGVY